MKINPRGYWENETSEGHGVDRNLVKGLIEFFKQFDYSWKLDIGLAKKGFVSIIDVGCGTGFYTKFLLDSGFSCYGFDGNPHTKELTDGLCQVFDFTKSIKKDFQYNYFYAADWVLCLEVGEHIPKEYEQIFLDNITFIAEEGIVLSWAIEGQGGDGHVNCRNNDYIINELARRGFSYSDKDTQSLRNKASNYPFTGWWFRQSLMVFYRGK